jgi:hypothetical protein
MNTRYKFNTLELGKRMIFVTLRHKLPQKMRKYEKLNSLILVILLLTDLWPIQATERATNTKNGFSTLELGKRMIFVTLGHKLPPKIRKCKKFNSLVSAIFDWPIYGRYRRRRG